MRAVTLALLVCMLTIVHVTSSPLQASESVEANQSRPQDSEDTERELNSLIRFLEENPDFLMQFLEAGNHQYADIDGHSKSEEDNHLARFRRRNTVFKNVYRQCRLQKRKEKDYCFHVANLYQNVKGYHGL